MHQIYKQQRILTILESASDSLYYLAKTSSKHVSSNIVVNLVKVLAISTEFQEFAFIVKYCPSMSTFGACIFASYTQNEYPIRCSQYNLHT